MSIKKLRKSTPKAWKPYQELDLLLLCLMYQLGVMPCSLNTKNTMLDVQLHNMKLPIERTLGEGTGKAVQQGPPWFNSQCPGRITHRPDSLTCLISVTGSKEFCPMDRSCPSMPFTPFYTQSGSYQVEEPRVRRWSRSFAWSTACRLDCPLESAGGWPQPQTAGSRPNGRSCRCPCHGKHLPNLNGKGKRW